MHIKTLYNLVFMHRLFNLNVLIIETVLISCNDQMKLNSRSKLNDKRKHRKENILNLRIQYVHSLSIVINAHSFSG